MDLVPNTYTAATINSLPRINSTFWAYLSCQICFSYRQSV